MRYALKYCEIDESGISGACLECGQELGIPITDTLKKIQRWKNGELIQNVLSELSEEQREFLISGYCPACWDFLFGE